MYFRDVFNELKTNAMGQNLMNLSYVAEPLILPVKI